MKGLLVVVVAVMLSGCYGLPTTPEAPPGCGFPEGTHFVFIGTTSAAALGLPNGDAQVRRWWVSSERLPWAGFHLAPGQPVPPPSPKACGILRDSMALQSLPLDWHPPFDAGSS